MGPLPPLPKARLKEAARLSQRKFRESSSLVLLEGARIVGDAIGDNNTSVQYCVVEENHVIHYMDLIRSAAARGIPVYRSGIEDFKRISDTVNSQGIIAVAVFSLKAPDAVFDGSDGGGVFVALTAASDPGNLGTIIRSSDWFGARGLLLSPGCVDPTNPKTVRATMGSLFHISIARYWSHADLCALARDRGCEVAAGVHDGDVSIRDFTPDRALLLILGSEAHGLPADVAEQADVRLTIPGGNRAESLNLAVAHGIILSYLTRP